MLKNKILDEINKNKKLITIEKYIELCLYSKYGYYKESNVLGKKGDFTTGPEISQLFGEIIGFFIINNWQSNINQSFNLIELGPGKGTLILDILNITNNFHKFTKSLNIYLIDKNKNLIKEQKNRLNQKKLNINNIKWLSDFKLQSKKPIVLIANEFFDCLPIRQFYTKQNRWYEKMITTNEDTLQFKDVEINDTKTLNKINEYQPEKILEFSNSREKYFNKICKHIKNTGGMMMIIDYGYFKKPKNFTLQSIHNNIKSNVLDNIGKQDITSLVDFKKLINLAKLNNLHVNIFCSQREFFLKYGIKQRAKKITNQSTNEQKILIEKGLNRIIDKDNMGSLYKVLVIQQQTNEKLL